MGIIVKMETSFNIKDKIDESSKNNKVVFKEENSKNTFLETSKNAVLEKEAKSSLLNVDSSYDSHEIDNFFQDQSQQMSVVAKKNKENFFNLTSWPKNFQSNTATKRTLSRKYI